MAEATLTFPDKTGKPGTTTGVQNETCLKADLTPSALFHQTNLTLPLLIRSPGFFSSLSCLSFQDVRQSVEHSLFAASGCRRTIITSAPRSRLDRRKRALAGIGREDNRAVEKDDRPIDIWRRGSRCTPSTTRIAPACRLVLGRYAEHLQGGWTHMQSSRSNMPGSAAPTGSKGRAMYLERRIGQVECVVFPIPVFRK